tara:strand:- start:2744 stop:3232 length:489 start_codon:yes stop_codon:yes gene_type:complete
MFSEVGKFTRNHPFLAFVFAATTVYVASENFRAIQAGKGDYWNRGIYGIGSGPFARHQQMKSMRVNPTGASTSTTTSSSSSHAMFRNPDEEPGAPSMPMPMMLHGVPSNVKRRVNHGEFNQEVLPDEYGISGMHMADSPKDHTDILGSEHGVMPMMGGDGWI